MAFFLYASFPNSRIKPRPATSQASTNSVSVASGATTLIKAANPNRTYIELRNIDPATTVFYGYVTPLTALTGFELLPNDSVNVLSPGDVYVFNPGAGAVLIDYDEGEG